MNMNLKVKSLLMLAVFGANSQLAVESKDVTRPAGVPLIDVLDGTLAGVKLGSTTDVVNLSVNDVNEATFGYPLSNDKVGLDSAALTFYLETSADLNAKTNAGQSFAATDFNRLIGVLVRNPDTNSVPHPSSSAAESNAIFNDKIDPAKPATLTARFTYGNKEYSIKIDDVKSDKVVAFYADITPAGLVFKGYNNEIDPNGILKQSIVPSAFRVNANVQDVAQLLLANFSTACIAALRSNISTADKPILGFGQVRANPVYADDSGVDLPGWLQYYTGTGDLSPATDYVANLLTGGTIAYNVRKTTGGHRQAAALANTLALAIKETVPSDGTAADYAGIFAIDPTNALNEYDTAVVAGRTANLDFSKLGYIGGLSVADKFFEGSGVDVDINNGGAANNKPVTTLAEIIAAINSATTAAPATPAGLQALESAIGGADLRLKVKNGVALGDINAGGILNSYNGVQGTLGIFVPASDSADATSLSKQISKQVGASANVLLPAGTAKSLAAAFAAPTAVGGQYASDTELRTSAIYAKGLNAIIKRGSTAPFATPTVRLIRGYIDSINLAQGALNRAARFSQAVGATGVNDVAAVTYSKTFNGKTFDFAKDNLDKVAEIAGLTKPVLARNAGAVDALYNNFKGDIKKVVSDFIAGTSAHQVLKMVDGSDVTSSYPLFTKDSAGNPVANKFSLGTGELLLVRDANNTTTAALYFSSANAYDVTGVALATSTAAAPAFKVDTSILFANQAVAGITKDNIEAVLNKVSTLNVGAANNPIAIQISALNAKKAAYQASLSSFVDEDLKKTLTEKIAQVDKDIASLSDPSGDMAKAVQAAQDFNAGKIDLAGLKKALGVSAETAKAVAVDVAKLTEGNKAFESIFGASFSKLAAIDLTKADSEKAVVDALKGVTDSDKMVGAWKAQLAKTANSKANAQFKDILKDNLSKFDDINLSTAADADVAKALAAVYTDNAEATKVVDAIKAAKSEAVKKAEAVKKTEAAKKADATVAKKVTKKAVAKKAVAKKAVAKKVTKKAAA